MVTFPSILLPSLVLSHLYLYYTIILDMRILQYGTSVYNRVYYTKYVVKAGIPWFGMSKSLQR